MFNDSEKSGSQLIESVSSDNKSVVNSEIIVQEVKSDTSKTVSDLIEDINCSQPFHVKKSELLSQNISNPSSHSSDDISNVEDSSVPVTSTLDINQQFTPSFTQIDQIDITSTPESKLEVSKNSYLLKCFTDKSQKKKNPKK